MILLIDNYDSFTYNLYQSLASQGAEVQVHRNDALTKEEALALNPSAIIFSPGPGRPKNSGICPELLKEIPDSLPFLGICLGHQALVESLGGHLELDPVPTHGKSSLMHHDGECSLFQDLPNPFPAGRYHSLRAVRSDLPDCLHLRSWTEDGLVMAVEHKTRPWFGLQFHPESILTPQGDKMMAHFLQKTGIGVSTR
ncbi:MAG: aminodeoxychorismate/anthranilate synthase component II [Planctomycetota bacterium]|jgi:anthranilate synthase component 2|nr:aminodeoxychorismate/anthranilate synthase component II [Planctomycetota bacterium]